MQVPEQGDLASPIYVGDNLTASLCRVQEIRFPHIYTYTEEHM